ncbi:hypothetical protein SMICM304S_09147 [Streptomyces microflavus]
MMWWSISPFAADDADLDEDTLKLVDARPEDVPGRHRARARRHQGVARRRLAHGLRHRGPRLATRTVEVLGGEGIAARFVPDLAEIAPSVVHVSCGAIDQGFVDPALKLAVFTETDLTGQRSATKDLGRMPARQEDDGLKRLHPKTVIKPTAHQILVPRPTTGRIGGKPVVGRELLSWTRGVPHDDPGFVARVRCTSAPPGFRRGRRVRTEGGGHGRRRDDQRVRSLPGALRPGRR